MSSHKWKWRIVKDGKTLGHVLAPTLAEAAKLAVKKGWRGFTVRFVDSSDR